MKKLLQKLESSGELDRVEIGEAVGALLSDAVATAEKEEFLSRLHKRGETPGEIACFVEALLAHAVQPDLGARGHASPPLLDVCGTGGDRAGLFNVSTAVIFVAAACGVHVVKHGNRGLTSKCGGADVLQELGVPIDIPASEAGEFLHTHGFVFFFAPQYHPAFKAIAPVRQALAARGQTTVFNILGPLLNPARPDYQLSGVFNPALLETYAEVFRLLGRKRAWAVHGELAGGGGLDEISPNGISVVYAVEDGCTSHSEIRAQDFIQTRGDSAGLIGGGPVENAAILRGILSGRDHSLRRSIVEINAAAALTVSGCTNSLGQGLEAARAALDSGAAWDVLQKSTGA